MADRQRIKEYILYCRDMYTCESITETLLKQGHSLEDIELEWQSLAELSRTISLPESRRKRGLGEVILFFVVIGGGLFLCPAFFLAAARGTGVTAFPFVDPFFLVAEIAMSIELGRSLRGGMKYKEAAGILLAVNFTWFLVIFGICTFRP